MRRYGPLLTVLAVVVVGAVLFVANSAGNPANRPAAAAVVAASTAAAPSGTPVATTSALPEAAAATPSGPAPAVAEKAYAGRTSGNEMTIAVAVKAGRAVAYVCDGKKVEAWLEGTLAGSDLSLRSANGSATVTGTVDAEKALGVIAVAGRSYPFAAKAAVAPAGLYQGRADVKGVATKIGWIVLGDGSQTGVAQPAGGQPGPAPVLDPARLDGVTVDGAPVTVTAIGGGDEVIG